MFNFEKILPLLQDLAETSHLCLSNYPSPLQPYVKPSPGQAADSYARENLAPHSYFGQGRLQLGQIKDLSDKLKQPNMTDANARKLIMVKVDKALNYYRNLLASYETVDAGETANRIENHLYRVYTAQAITRINDEDRATFYADYMRIINIVRTEDVTSAISCVELNYHNLAQLALYRWSKKTMPLRPTLVAIFGEEAVQLLEGFSNGESITYTPEQIALMTTEIKALFRRYHANMFSTSTEVLIQSVKTAIDKLEKIQVKVKAHFTPEAEANAVGAVNDAAPAPTLVAKSSTHSDQVEQAVVAPQDSRSGSSAVILDALQQPGQTRVADSKKVELWKAALEKGFATKPIIGTHSNGASNANNSTSSASSTNTKKASDTSVSGAKLSTAMGMGMGNVTQKR